MAVHTSKVAATHQLSVHKDPRSGQPHRPTLALLVEKQQVSSGEVVVTPLGERLLYFLASPAIVDRHFSHTVVIQHVSLRHHTQTITCTLKHTLLVPWHSGNTLCQINKVRTWQARLVLGWVTVYGQVNHLGTKPAS